MEKTEAIEYNTDGNIVRYGENTYEYDRIGRLVRENNKNLDKTYTWVYNEGGNIVSKNEYAYTEGILESEPTKTYAYTYGNAWKDQLTGFDGQSIVYDASGNPTSYLGATLSWSKGRLLTGFTKGTKNVTMFYDSNGVRRSKISFVIGGARVSTSFIYDSHGRLRTETDGTYTRRYLYSTDGIMGFEENGVLYLYRKNLFGDITAIYQGSTKVAEYEYDAWGNCTITYNTNGVGTRNPFRYRGYYFDTDLEMYYLLTRYYDPKTGRFINADSLEYLDPNKINGLNLYAYCRNNPVMMVDYSGNDPIAILLSCLVALIACTAAVAINNLSKYRNGEYEEYFNGTASESSDTALMKHKTFSLIDNYYIGGLLANLSYTRTEPLNNNEKLLYSFLDVGDDEVNSGIGINIFGIWGLDFYFSTNAGLGINLQYTPWTTIGLELSLMEGISLSVGVIINDVTHEGSINVGVIGLAAVVVSLSFILYGSSSLSTVAAILLAGA